MALQELALAKVPYFPDGYQSVEDNLRDTLSNKIKNTKGLREKLKILNDEADGFYQWYVSKVEIDLQHIQSILIIFQDHLENLFPLIQAELSQNLIDFWNNKNAGNDCDFIAHCRVYWDDIEWAMKTERNISVNILCNYNCPKILKYVIDKEYNDENNLSVEDDLDFLMTNACLHGYFENFKIILTKQLKINNLSLPSMRNYFHASCVSGNLEMVQYILSFFLEGYPLEIKEAFKNAIKNEHFHIVKYLLSKKYDVNNIVLIIEKAIKHCKKTDIIKHLVEEMNVKINQHMITLAYVHKNKEVIAYFKEKKNVERDFDQELIWSKID